MDEKNVPSHTAYTFDFAIGQTVKFGPTTAKVCGVSRIDNNEDVYLLEYETVSSPRERLWWGRSSIY